MKLEEAVEHLELFKDDLNELKPNEDFILQDGMKFDTVEALQRVLHYIKEESIPRAVIEEKIKELIKNEKFITTDFIRIDTLQELLKENK